MTKSKLAALVEGLQPQVDQLAEVLSLELTEERDYVQMLSTPIDKMALLERADCRRIGSVRIERRTRRTRSCSPTRQELTGCDAELSRPAERSRSQVGATQWAQQHAAHHDGRHATRGIVGKKPERTEGTIGAACESWWPRQSLPRAAAGAEPAARGAERVRHAHRPARRDGRRSGDARVWPDACDVLDDGQRDARVARRTAARPQSSPIASGAARCRWRTTRSPSSPEAVATAARSATATWQRRSASAWRR